MSNTRFKQSQTDHSSSDIPKPTGRPDYWHRQALPDRTKRRTEHTNRFVEFTQRRAEFRLAYTISHSLQAKLIMHQKNLTYYPWSLLSQRHFFCAKMGITLMYKCVTLSLLKMEEATADKMLNPIISRRCRRRWRNVLTAEARRCMLGWSHWVSPLSLLFICLSCN